MIVGINKLNIIAFTEQSRFQILSTGTQKARKKGSRQLDVISDLKNMYVMLGAFARSELKSNQGDKNTEVDIESENGIKILIQLAKISDNYFQIILIVEKTIELQLRLVGWSIVK